MPGLDRVPTKPGMGYTLTRSGWVPPRPGMGYPPDLGQGTPLDLGWGTPPDLGLGTPPDLGPGTPLDLGPGTPQTWDQVPLQTWDQVPPPTWDWVTPWTWDWVPPTPTLDLEPGTPPPTSTASTCYAAGGVPLAFTQEDFLVQSFFTLKVLDDKQRVTQWFFAGSRLVQILFCKEDYNISAFHCNV